MRNSKVHNGNPDTPSATHDIHSELDIMPEALRSRTLASETDAMDTQDAPAYVPSIATPKGGGAITSIGEKFSAQAFTGTANMSVPIFTSPARSLTPSLALSYDSGAGNGPFGMGWQLSTESIQRRTSLGVPQYLDDQDSDIFTISGFEDLIPRLELDATDAWQRVERIEGNEQVVEYRPRVEAGFARIERRTDLSSRETHWETWTSDNIRSIYGFTAQAKIVDPQQPLRVFQWLLEARTDQSGNAIAFIYKSENDVGVSSAPPIYERGVDLATAQKYLKRIRYGNTSMVPTDGSSVCPSPRAVLSGMHEDRSKWHFEVVLDYGDQVGDRSVEASPETWPVRDDAFSSYRSGFEIRTRRRCQRVMMFHRFAEAFTGPGPEPDERLVATTELDYNDRQVPAADEERGAQLFAVTQRRYRGLGTATPQVGAFPPIHFDYTRAVVGDTVEAFAPDTLANIPGGADGERYQFLDLDGEGLPGILSEQAGVWYYKSPLGGARYGEARALTSRPSRPGLSMLDLDGNGERSLVDLSGSNPGYFERSTCTETWKTHRPLPRVPAVDHNDPRVHQIDLSGDGLADLLVDEGDRFIWYPSLGKQGYAEPREVPQHRSEELAPQLIYGDAQQLYTWADMSGDGLADIVRIRVGEVCYWPNLGHGRFGTKIVMANAPMFASQDEFRADRVRVGDIDGSGPSDLVYLGKHGVEFFINRSGNSFAPGEPVVGAPAVDDLGNAQLVDVLGDGTACLVWTSSNAARRGREMAFVRLMAAGKPYLLREVDNQRGLRTRAAYVPSTHFYLQAKAEGRPWRTKLHFPVQVVAKSEAYDAITDRRFCMRYEYAHGYYDGYEREFRGFGRVDQFDTELFGGPSLFDEPGANYDGSYYTPPVQTTTWFHLGGSCAEQEVSVSRQFADEYWYEEEGTTPKPAPLGDSVLVGQLTQEKSSAIFNRPSYDDGGRWVIANAAMLGHGEAMTQREELEALRSLRGRPLRVEVRAAPVPEGHPGHDDPKQALPFTVTETNYSVLRVQPRALRGEYRYASFVASPRETISRAYDRHQTQDSGSADLVFDPRSRHSLVLTIDRFARPLKTLAVSYPRRDVEGRWDRQEEIAAVLSESWVKHLDIYEQAGDRARQIASPIESRSYEFPLNPSLNLDDLDNPLVLDTTLQGSVENATEVAPESSVAFGQKRLLTSNQTYYYPTDEPGNLTVAATPGALFDLGPRAIIYESHTAVASTNQVDGVYLAGGLAANRGEVDQLWLDGLVNGKPTTTGYVLHDGLYWRKSGRSVPDGNDFYLATTGLDPLYKSGDFEGVYTSKFKYSLLLENIKDPLGNETSATFDWEALAPIEVVDLNDNLTEIAYNNFGLPSAVAVRSASGDEGDTLAVPTIAYTYEFDSWRTSGEPLHARVFTRTRYAQEKLLSDETAPLGEQFGADILESVVYSDGGGRLALQKVQAEPGDAFYRLGNGELATTGSGADTQLDRRHSDPRWVASGRTVVDNKGNPVRQYEPYFIEDDRYDPETELAQLGVTPHLHYDVIGRNIRTEFPDGSLTRVEITPWELRNFDANDTVNQSDWLAERQGAGVSAADQDAAAKSVAHADTPSKSFIDSRGRTFMEFADLNGGEGIQVARSFDFEGNILELGTVKIDGTNPLDPNDLGKIAVTSNYGMGGMPLHETSADAGPRWSLPNAVGSTMYMWDRRDDDPGGPGTVLRRKRTVYDLLHRPKDLFQQEGTNPEELLGRTFYGEELADMVVPQDPKLTHHRGQVYQSYDGAGVATVLNYDFQGRARLSRRVLAAVDIQQLQPTSRIQAKWTAFVGDETIDGMEQAVTASSKLDSDPAYSSNTRTMYDALGRVLQSASADGSVRHYTYNHAGLLEKVDLQHGHDGSGTKEPIVSAMAYDERARRLKIVYGDAIASSPRRGTTTEYSYDRRSYRVTRIKSYKNDGQAVVDDNRDCGAFETDTSVVGTGLQDLRYTYDAAGNITRQEDREQQVIFHSNAKVCPANDYTYDGLNRLVMAKGREHASNCALPGPKGPDLSPHVNLPSDGQAMRNYERVYTYDELGNILKMQHRVNASQDCWTREYRYDAFGCRLLKTWEKNDIEPPSDTYLYNHNGQMVQMPGLEEMAWDDFDQLAYTRDGDKHLWYVYDGGGQRVRKIVRNSDGGVLSPNVGTSSERVYFGGDFERFRAFVSGTLDTETETLHVSDDMGRICLIDAQVRVSGSVANPVVLKYQFELGNHLGSSSMSLTEGGDVISYEEYHPYGTSSYQAGQNAAEVAARRYRYTGKERDEETGLYYHGARYYAPWLGRWTAADPIGIGDGMNRFAYVRGNPVTSFDPNGRETKNTTASVASTGHASPRYKHPGKSTPEQKNQELSERRSAAVASYVEARLAQILEGRGEDYSSQPGAHRASVQTTSVEGRGSTDTILETGGNQDSNERAQRRVDVVISLESTVTEVVPGVRTEQVVVPENHSETASTRWNLTMVGTLSGGEAVGGMWQVGRLRNLKTGDYREVHLKSVGMTGGLPAGVTAAPEEFGITGSTNFTTRTPLHFTDFDNAGLDTYTASFVVLGGLAYQSFEFWSIDVVEGSFGGTSVALGIAVDAGAWPAHLTVKSPEEDTRKEDEVFQVESSVPEEVESTKTSEHTFSVHFESDSATISEEGYQELDRQIEAAVRAHQGR